MSGLEAGVSTTDYRSLNGLAVPEQAVLAVSQSECFRAFLPTDQVQSYERAQSPNPP